MIIDKIMSNVKIPAYPAYHRQARAGKCQIKSKAEMSKIVGFEL